MNTLIYGLITGIAFGFLLQKGRQDVIGRVHPSRRPADPDANPKKISLTELLHDRPDTVVPTMSSRLDDLHATEIDIQVIMDDDQLLG